MAIYVTVTYFRPGSCTHLKISVSFIVLSFVSVTFSGRKKNTEIFRLVQDAGVKKITVKYVL